MPTLETRIETYLEMADKLEYANKEIERLKKEYTGSEKTRLNYLNELNNKADEIDELEEMIERLKKENNDLLSANEGRGAFAKAQCKQMKQLEKEKEWLLDNMVYEKGDRQWIENRMQLALKEGSEWTEQII